MLVFVVTMWWRTRQVRKSFSNGSPDVANHLRISPTSRRIENAGIVVFMLTGIGLAACFLVYLFQIVGG